MSMASMNPVSTPASTVHRPLDLDPLLAVTPTLARLATMSDSDPEREKIRSDIICRCTPAARREAARYSRTGEPMDDLVQVAVLGLILAVDRFDPVRGIPFKHFALPTITGELKRYFRDKGWSVRVNRRIQELCQEVRKAEPELTQQLGRTATVSDLAEHLRLPERDILLAREGEAVHFARSLNRPVFSDGDAAELGDTLGADDRAIAAVPDRDALRQALRALPPRLAMIVSLRFQDDLTQAQIGDKMGISQMHVSRLLDRAMNLLRGHMTADQQPAAPATESRARSHSRRPHLMHQAA